MFRRVIEVGLYWLIMAYIAVLLIWDFKFKKKGG